MALPFLLSRAEIAVAQSADGVKTPSLTEAALKTDELAGLSASDTLSGNGTAAGYMLKHGGILPGSLNVRVNGTPQHLNRDFWLDAGAGTLYFAKPISHTDTISIYYRYQESKDGTGSRLAVPGLQFNFGATGVNLLYGSNAFSASGNGFDVSTYGLGLNSRFDRKGLSGYSGMFFYSNTQKSANPLTQLDKSVAVNGPAPEAGNDHLITQSLTLQTGSLSLHGDYQDVGKNFTGFQALRGNAGNDKSLLDRLTQMESEKGVKRAGFGLGLNFGPQSRKAGTLSFDVTQLQDGNGSINQQMASLEAGAFHFHYANRDVSDQFTQFSGLRESDKTQWAQEKGVKTSHMDFGLNFNGKKGASLGGLNFATMQFGDKDGGLTNSLWALNTNQFGVQMFRRSADKAFAHIASLSVADKTELALQIYRQYNPTATAQQVTDADRARLTSEAGLKRDGMRFDAALGKKGAFAFGQTSVRDAQVGSDGAVSDANAFQRDSLSLNTGKLSLNWMRRKTDSGFSRLADLSDIEKNMVALDIRRQFNLSTTLADVTQKERDQIAKEAGLARNALQALMKLNRTDTLEFNNFSIASESADKTQPDNKGAIRRQSLSFTGRKVQFSLLDQTISDNFARLTDLSDIEKAQFGNEHGLRKQQVALTIQVNKLTKLGYNQMRLGASPDAVAAAGAAAQKSSSDPNAATLAAQNGLKRQSVTLETKGFSLTSNSASTDKNFTRSADLALPDADKAQIESERGFQRSDLTAKFDLLKWLNLTTYHYKSDNPTDKVGRETYKDVLTLLPLKLLGISFQRDADITRSDDKKNGTEHSLLNVNKDFGKGMLFQYYRDINNTYAQDVTSQSADTKYMRFEVGKGKPNTLLFEKKDIGMEDGKYENTVNLNVHVKPAKSLALNFTKLDVDRDEKNPDETTDALDLEWQATKAFAVVAGFSNKDTTNDQDVKAISVGLKGEPIKNFTVTAKFDELHNVSQNTKDVADISISNAKPISFGPVQNLTVTARYASLNDKRVLQNETMTGRATFKLWKNDVVLDYGGYTKEDATSTITRVYSFTTDQNPKNWFHGSFLYKSRTLVDGEEKLIRRFTADARLSKLTSLVYTFGTLPEDDKGNMTPLTTADFSLKQAFGGHQSLSLFYRSSNNETTKITQRSLGFGLDGKFAHNSKYELGFSLDTNGIADNYRRSRHFRIALNHQYSATHSLTLSADFGKFDGQGIVNDFQTNLEFRREF